jgi:hypothetical protein
MSKLSDLVSKGVRLIVTESGELPPEAAEIIEPTPAAPPPRPAREREIPAQAFEASAPKRVARSEVPADADFARVYDEAGIEPPTHGYGVEKVSELLENKRLAALPREVKASAVLAALEAAGVPIRDVIQDAVLRDKALDAFEAAKQRELQELRARSQARITQLQGELDELVKKIGAEIESLKRGGEAAEQALQALLERKRREEERLHGIVSHFIEGADNPITAAPRPPGPAKPV